MSLEAVQAAIPHRDPFLLVDEIVAQDERTIHCRKTFTGDEYFYRGHYPAYPITPGVLLCEAGMQAGAVLLSKQTAATPGKVPVATRIDSVRFKRMVRPGDVIDIEVELVERLADAFFMKAKVSCGGQVAARFEFACTLAEPQT
ncbi:MAG: 3-hydroxyacyl-ACP dehydratase FabZ [Planctomycetaceae bacterium]|nr:3-hydroxyacyl-ACP dehydratase FabZ [Planctomycetaceae bacterium]